MAIPSKQTDALKTLAFEYALQYYPPEELADRFGVPLEQLQSLSSAPEFRKMVLTARREIDEQGTQMKIAARKLAAELLPTIAQIVTNERYDVSDRLNAYKQLAGLAGADATSADGNGGFAVNIQINT